VHFSFVARLFSIFFLLFVFNFDWISVKILLANYRVIVSLSSGVCCYSISHQVAYCVVCRSDI